MESHGDPRSKKKQQPGGPHLGRLKKQRRKNSVVMPRAQYIYAERGVNDLDQRLMVHFDR